MTSWSRGDSQVGIPAPPTPVSLQRKCGRLISALVTLLFRCGVPPVEERGGREPDQGDPLHHLAVQPTRPQNRHGHGDAGRANSRVSDAPSESGERR